MSKRAAPDKKRPGDALVFGYRNLPYGRYAIVQIVLFPLLAVGVFVYFQYFSQWRGGFMHVRAAYLPILCLVAMFLVVALYAPIRDFLTIRNERVEVRAERILFFNLFGRKRFDARISEVSLLRAGTPVTSRIKRYVFTANGKSFYFSADIDNVSRLLKILGQKTE